MQFLKKKKSFFNLNYQSCKGTLVRSKKIHMELEMSITDPSAFSLLSPYLTGVAQLVRLSSGSGCSATCCLCDARHESPLTGWTAADPGRQQTESGGCRRCRLHPRRSGAHGGSGWWCGSACCS